MTASIIVLASGRGTNLQALIDACASGALPARIVAVYSHTPTALALERARRHGIPATFVAPPQKHSSQPARDEWDAALGGPHRGGRARRDRVRGLDAHRR
jgi:phosphoribosylglycinamide formyltransferase-1